ncbi:MAG: molybdopterin-dependent oxidoreductase [Caldimonas sp.]
MNKRRFLAATMIGTVAGAAALPAAARKGNNSKAAPRGPTLLTVSGLIGPGNRGPFDPMLDQLMGKQKLAFAKAQTFEFWALSSLPAITINPTLEYDRRPHALTGPLLTDVMLAAGVQPTTRTTYFVRAIDGYAAAIRAAEATERRFIVATHLDGQPMALGGLGPLWTIYDPGRVPEMAAKPLAGRFAQCPWATYHVEVREG